MYIVPQENVFKMSSAKCWQFCSGLNASKDVIIIHMPRSIIPETLYLQSAWWTLMAWYQDILNHADESNTVDLMDLAVVYMPRCILPGTL